MPPELQPIGDPLVSFNARTMPVDVMEGLHQEYLELYLNGEADAVFALHRLSFLCLNAIERCRQLEERHAAPGPDDRVRSGSSERVPPAVASPGQTHI